MAVDHFAINSVSDIYADGDSLDVKFTKIRDYLFQITESLNYTLHHLGAENFSDSEYAMIKNPEDDSSNIEARLSSLEQNVNNINDILSDLQDTVSELSGLPAQVETLQDTVNGLSGVPGQIAAMQNTLGNLQNSVNTLNQLISVGTDGFGNPVTQVGNALRPTLIYGSYIMANNNQIG